MAAQRETWYSALELPYGASWDDVRSAFRRLARRYHPDVAGSEWASHFQTITDAYASLRAELFGSPSAKAERSVSVARESRIDEILAGAEREMEDIMREADRIRREKEKSLLLRLHSRRLDVRLLAMDALFRLRSTAYAKR